MDESGVTITPSIETDPVKAWQSAVPVLYNVKGASFQIKATLLETSKLTTETFYGASWVEVMSEDTTPVPTGVFRLDLFTGLRRNRRRPFRDYLRPSRASGRSVLQALCRRAAAMLVAPASRRAPMARLPQVAIARGALPVRSCEASSPNVVSLT